MGPGLFEVCRASTREPVAFGCTRNIVDSLCDVLKPRGLRRWFSFRRGQQNNAGEFEYRTWPTASVGHARNVARMIRERQQVVLRKQGIVRA
jgi:hypothetical protein